MQDIFIRLFSVPSIQGNILVHLGRKYSDSNSDETTSRYFYYDSILSELGIWCRGVKI